MRDFRKGIEKALGGSGLPRRDAAQLADDLTFIYLSRRVQRYIQKKDRAPLYCRRADKSQTPVDFLDEVWGDFLREKALYQDQLGKIDPELLEALKSYLPKRRQTPSAYISPKTDRVRLFKRIRSIVGVA